MSVTDKFRWLMTRLSGGFVLAFHEINPERLSEFVEYFWPARPVPLSELVERSKNGKSTSSLFAITIDDGVGENVRNLARLFLQKSWPATFYLPTRYLETGEGMVFQWWRLVKPLLPAARVELTSGVIDLSHPGSLERLSRVMETAWHTERLESYYRTTMDLAAIATRGRRELRPPAPVSWSEVQTLSRTGLIQFESHAVSHVAMSALTREELVSEMQHSRDLVSEHTGQICRHLAYPFGSPQSVGSLAVDVASRFYDSATTMSLGGVDHTHPWLLPRIPLYPENSNLLARSKVLVKCSTPKRFSLRSH